MDVTNTENPVRTFRSKGKRLTKAEIRQRFQETRRRLAEESCKNEESGPQVITKEEKLVEKRGKKVTRRWFLKIFGTAALGLAVEELEAKVSGRESWVMSLLNRVISHRESTINVPVESPIHDPAVPNGPDIPKAPEIAAVPEYIIEDYKLLNEILAQPIDYPEPEPGKEFKKSKRQIKEEEYVQRCLAPDINPKRKLERIDRGFMVVGDYRLRTELLEERWKLRQEGKSGLRPLTPEEIAWAKSRDLDGTTEGIHPEVLAICTDAYFQAREHLLKLKAEKGDKFLRFIRPDLYLMKEKGELPSELEAKLDNLSVDDMLMNPGAMAELVCQETDRKTPPDRDKKGNITKKYPRWGLTHIGHVAAKPQLKTNADKETEKQAVERETQEASLTKLMRIISQDTKIQTRPNEFIMLQYNEHRVPGSIANKGDIRAGALGLQFMPATALGEYTFNKENFEIGFNPFGLEAVVGAYIMLARGMISVDQQSGKKSYLRFGYLKGTYPRKGKDDLGESLRHDAIERWNPHDYEIKQVLQTADDYYEEIVKQKSLQPSTFDGKIVPMYKDNIVAFPLYKKAA